MADKGKRNSRDNGKDRKRGSNKAPEYRPRTDYMDIDPVESRRSGRESKSQTGTDFDTTLDQMDTQKAPKGAEARSYWSKAKEKVGSKFNTGSKSIQDPVLKKLAKGRSEDIGVAIRDMEIRGNVNKAKLLADLKTIDKWKEDNQRNARKIATYVAAKGQSSNLSKVAGSIEDFQGKVRAMPNELQKSATVSNYMSVATRDLNRAESRLGVTRSKAKGEVADKKTGFFGLYGKRRGDVAEQARAESKIKVKESKAERRVAEEAAAGKRATAKDKEAEARIKFAETSTAITEAQAKEAKELEEAKFGKRFLGFGPRYGGSIKKQKEAQTSDAEARALEAKADKLEAQGRIEQAQIERLRLKGEAPMTGTREGVSLRRRQMMGTRAVAEAFEEAGKVEGGKGRIAKEELDRFTQELREGAPLSQTRVNRLNRALKVARAKETPAFLSDKASGTQYQTGADTATEDYIDKTEQRLQRGNK